MKKIKKGYENKKVKRGRKDYWKNKVDPIIEKSSYSKIRDYYYIIYLC